jgi:hypothetical protein
MVELKMRRTASQPYTTFKGNSEFLPVSLEALQQALKVGEPTNLEDWGLNLEALKGNKIHQVTFAPNRNLCTWEMSVRGGLAFNLVGNLHITFEPLIDNPMHLLTRSKTVMNDQHYSMDLDDPFWGRSLMPLWEKAQSN